MFDFTPVGAAVAGAGVAFIAPMGWCLVPARQGPTEGFDLAAYLTEVRVGEGSKAEGMTLRQLEEVLEKVEAQIVGVRAGEHADPHPPAELGGAGRGHPRH